MAETLEIAHQLDRRSVGRSKQNVGHVSGWAHMRIENAGPRAEPVRQFLSRLVRVDAGQADLKS